MTVRPLEPQDLPALLELLEQQDAKPELRAFGPESRDLKALELELSGAPGIERFPFVLTEGKNLLAYTCLCDYDDEHYLEGPIAKEGVMPSHLNKLMRATLNEASKRHYAFIEAFSDEENSRAQEVLQAAGFEAFHTTYIYRLELDHAARPKVNSLLDFEQPGTIDERSYRDLYRDTSETWAERLAWSEEDIIAHFADPDIRLLFAYQEGQLIGHAELELSLEEGYAELSYFGVLPAFRGYAFGQELVLQALDIARQEDLDLVLARAHDDERAACYALERVGFRLSHGVVAFTLTLN